MQDVRGNVFISYSRVDSKFVNSLDAELTKDHFVSWVDTRQLRGGQIFDDEIRRAIERADIVLVILSTDALQSRWVRKEYRYALQLGKPVIPVIYRDCQPPKPLRKLQFIKFAVGMDYSTEYPHNYALLVEAMARNIATAKEKSRAQPSQAKQMINRFAGKPRTVRRRISTFVLRLVLVCGAAYGLLITGSHLFPTLITLHVPVLQYAPGVCGLDQVPESFQITVDPNGLIANAPAASTSVEMEVRSALSSSANRTAGLVNVFVGSPTSTSNDTDFALQVAAKIVTALRSLGATQHFVFSESATAYQQFFVLGQGASEVRVQIFMFSCTPR